MGNKTERLLEIKSVIAGQKISKQEELLDILISKGFDITQATLSRDLKELNAGTKNDDVLGHVYYLDSPNNNLAELNSQQELTGAISLTFSGQLAVLKTEPGLANSVAVKIDKYEFRDIIGTVAGNDTIMLVLRESFNKTEFIRSFEKIFINIIQLIKP